MSQLEAYIFNFRKIEIKKPVFISGMARSGTTFTTHLLFSSENFSSLQYKDLPFYKIIILWSYFSRIYYGYEKFSERIHGDKLLVSINSPDSFEELIWKNNLDNYLSSGFYQKINENYINNNLLNDLTNLIKKTLYIKKKNRYLSKNNYNIFRLKYLFNHYKDSNSILLFRDPIDTINSLVKVHYNFINLEKNNKTFGEELEILGHHEFGPKRKAFNIGENYERTTKYWTNGDDYNGYLLQWIDLYSFVLREYKDLIVSKKILLLQFTNNLNTDFCNKIVNFCKINNSDKLFEYFKKFSSYPTKKNGIEINIEKKYIEESYKIFEQLIKLSNK